MHWVYKQIVETSIDAISAVFMYFYQGSEIWFWVTSCDSQISWLKHHVNRKTFSRKQGLYIAFWYTLIFWRLRYGSRTCNLAGSYLVWHAKDFHENLDDHQSDLYKLIFVNWHLNMSSSCFWLEKALQLENAFSILPSNP